MPRPSNQISISLRLERSLLDRIDEAAKARTIDRSAFIRTATIAALEGNLPSTPSNARPEGMDEMKERLNCLEFQVWSLEDEAREQRERNDALANLIGMVRKESHQLAGREPS